MRRAVLGMALALVLGITALGVVALAGSAGRDDNTEYTMRIRIFDEATQQLVRGARLGMESLLIGGGNINGVSGAPSATIEALRNQQVVFGERGEVTVRLTKGRYELRVIHEDYDPLGFVFQVPPKDLSPGATALDFTCAFPAAALLPLVVKVVRADDGEAVENASVTVSELGPNQFAIPAIRETSKRGLTKVFRLKPIYLEESQTRYRVEVSASGMRTKSADLPKEYLDRKGPRTFEIRLDPAPPGTTGQPDRMTPAEKAAFDRFVAWSRSLPPNPRVPRTPLDEQETRVRVDWTEKNTSGDGPPYFDGRATVNFTLRKPDAPPMTPTVKSQKAVAVGSYMGVIVADRSRRSVEWYHGRFKVEVRWTSGWIDRPTEQEILAKANQVAAILGNPDK